MNIIYVFFKFPENEFGWWVDKKVLMWVGYCELNFSFSFSELQRFNIYTVTVVNVVA